MSTTCPPKRSRAAGRPALSLRRRAILPLLLITALLAGLVGALPPPTALAATFTVNHLGDDADAVPGDGVCATAGGVCTLRAAIMEANAWPGADTITFSVNGTILLNEAPPWISTDITITGPGANLLFVDGADTYPVLRIIGGTVTISGLTIQRGRAASNGAGISHLVGTLTLRDSVVRNNIIAGCVGCGGAGIYSQGSSLTILSSQVYSNTIQAAGSTNGGGIMVASSSSALISGTAVMSNTALCTDPGQGAFGGGVHTSGPTRIVNSTIRNNSAQNSSGSWGGGIYNSSFGNLAITNTQVLDNDARAGGGVMNHGALRMSGGTIHGNTVDIDGGGLKNEWSSGVVTLNGVTLDGNYSGTRGGAVYNESSGQVTLDGCTVSHNTGINNGGGLYNGQNGSPPPQLTLHNTQVLTNTSPGAGGGVYNCGTLNVTGGLFAGNQANGGFSWGGGIYNFCPGLAQATVDGTTFRNNSAVWGGGLFNWANLTLLNGLVTANTASIGGGICSWSGALVVQSTLILTNTASSEGGGLYSGGTLDLAGGTVRGNTAPTGAGIYNAGTLQSNGTIVSGNTATGAGGGIYSGAVTTLVLQNTAVSGNQGANGAGVYVDRLSTATITSSQFDGNQAGGSGGGLYNNGSTVSLADQTTVMNNSAASGGGLYNGDYVWSEFGTMNVTGCAIAGNTGQGIWSNGTMSVTASLLMNNDVGAYIVHGSATVVNSFIADNTAAGIRFGTMGPIDAVLSGTPANANTFGSNGPAGLLNVDVQTWNGNPRINAFWNDWGVVALQDVENTIWHQMDNADLARVDYYTLTMAAAPPVQAADGVSPVHITTTLGGWISPAAGDVVAFDTSLGNLGTVTATTAWNGQAFNTLTSLVTGRAYITASAAFDIGDRRAAYTDVLFVLPPADLSITKSDGQTTAVPGQPVTYTIVAGNAGPGSAPGSIVTDNFPAILTGVTWTCTGAGGGTCPPSGAGDINAIVDLPVGGTVTFVATGTVDPAATGTLVNTAAVTVPAGLTDPNPDNNSATDIDTLTPQADLAIAKGLTPAGALPGQPITYTVTFSNSGPSVATGVVITDIVPLTLTGVSVVSSGVPIVDTGHVPPYVWSVADMAPGAVGYITITAVVDPALNGDTAFTNTATIYSPVDADVGNNSASVLLTVTVPRVRFSSATYSVLEDAGAAPITVTLDAPNPYADVTVVYSTTNGTAQAGSDYIGVRAPLTIPAGSPGGSFAVQILDDAIVEGDETVLLSLSVPVGAALGTPDAATLTIVDDDVAGVVVTPTSGLVTTEWGGTATFSVYLTSEPTAAVTIGLVSSDLTEGTVAPAQLVFDAGNWATPQVATVTGVDDDVADGNVPYTIVTSLSSSDPVYALIDPDDVSVLNLDDETAGVVIVPTSGLITTEAGGSDTFTVYLTSQPTAAVTIALVSSDPTEGTVAPAQLVFDANNWTTPQVATVTGVDDDVADGNVPYTIVTSLSSSDPVYAPIDPDDVSVLNLDDDVAGVVVTPTSGLVTTEWGGTATFTVYLTSEPTAEVTIGLVSSDPTEGTVAPAQLVFDANNWATPQVATVTGVDDAVVDGDVPYTIVTSLSSSDPVYALIDPDDVSVLNLDDDHLVANYFVYLPLLCKECLFGPDLVVESLVATGTNVTVVVRNIGNGPALNAFWVDVYLDPNPAPTSVNQLWHDLTPQGLAWGLVSPAVPLWPGQAVTLDVNDAYLWPSRSHVVWPIPAGTAVYAQVDSWHPTTTYGAVRELHEAAGGPYNNILGPVYSTAGAAGAQVPVWRADPPAAGLPARP